MESLSLPYIASTYAMAEKPPANPSCCSFFKVTGTHPTNDLWLKRTVTGERNNNGRSAGAVPCLNQGKKKKFSREPASQQIPLVVVTSDW